MNESATFSKRDRKAKVEELQQRLIAVLESQRRLGGESYPVTLERLIELARESSTSTLVLEALKGAGFKNRVLIPAKLSKGQKNPPMDAPVCQVEDVTLLADSEMLLKFAFDRSRTEKNALFTPSELKDRLTSSKGIDAQFGQALKEKLAAGSFPTWMAYVRRRGHNYLFRLDDVVRSQRSIEKPAHAAVSSTPTNDSEPTAPRPSAPPVNFEEAFTSAFDRIDRQRGGKNFVKLRDLRLALPQFDREAFDGGVKQLWKDRKFTLDSADGNHKTLTEEERRAGIVAAGSNLVYCSRRTNPNSN